MTTINNRPIALRPARAFAYFPVLPGDAHTERAKHATEAEQCFCRMRAQGWLAGSEWGGCVPDEIPHPGVQFLARSGGRALNARLHRGDVVIIARPHNGHDARDLAGVVARWAARGVRVFVPGIESVPELDEGQAVQGIRLAVGVLAAGSAA